MKKISYVFWGLAALLLIVMCVVVAFYFFRMKKAIELEGYSAPAGTAFLYAIPFLVALVICVIIALAAGKKQ